MPEKKKQLYESDTLNWLLSEEGLTSEDLSFSPGRRERLTKESRQPVERDLVLRLIEWFKESK